MGHKQHSGGVGNFLWETIKFIVKVIFRICVLVFVFIGKLIVTILEKIIEVAEHKHNKH